MKPSKRILGAVAAVAALSLLAGCGGSSGGGSSSSSTEGQIYYLSFKPEQDKAWQEIGKAYTAETGVPVRIVTAAQGTYEQTLKAEMAKKDAPTLFQINGPVGGAVWKDYALDLSDTDFYNALLDKSMAVEMDGSVIGVPYVVEGYGIIYNDAIMKKYFALSGAKAKDMKEINSFAKLKEVADDMQARKAELGIDGVFACTSLKSGEDWRWQTHLANLPIWQEYKDAGVTSAKEITFKYNKEFKQLFDLYLTDSTVAASLTSGKSVTDSMAEFAMGKCAMVQNGNWAWGQISKVAGNTVKEADVKFLPIYMGLPDEANQGLCVGTENYFAVNAKASADNQAASIAFVNWLTTSDAGKKFMVGDLGFIPPFKGFDTAQPTDPLAKEVLKAMSDTTKKSVPWTAFQTFPSSAWKKDFGAALAQYADGKMPWDKVVESVVAGWKANQPA